MKFVRAAVVGIAAFALAGCGGGKPAPGASIPNPATSTPAAATALPLDQRVVPGDLAGLTSPAGVKTAGTPDAYVDLQSDPTNPDAAQQRANDISRFGDKAFVTGAVKIYGGDNAPGGGISSVVQLGSPAQAKAYVQNLYDDEFGTDIPPGAVKGTIEGSAASDTITDKETQDGDTVSHGWAAFADGPFVYLVAADTDAPGADPQAVIDAARALFDKVKGAPAT
jgi:hypothetical protein